MIITKKVKIKVSNNSIKFYKELGYKNIKQGDLIILDIEYLSKKSAVIIESECDYCGNIIKTTMYNYTNSIKTGKYCCKKCSPIKYSEIMEEKNTINVKCDYCGDIVSIRKYKYNENIKNNGKFSCKKCGPDKYRETCLKQYGVDNTSKLSQTHDKIKETCLERHGNENYRNAEQREKTKLEKYKGDYSSIVEKGRQTCLERFGVENASQCPEIFSKQQKARYEIHKFKNTDIFYQGTYEKNFLDNYYDKLEITKIKEIDYIFENKNKKYFSDYYLPDYNLIIEIKSSYIFEKFKAQNLAKQQSCIELGYNFLFIINKDYTKLNAIVVPLGLEPRSIA